MNVNLLAVVTPPYIYHGCFNCKTLWEVNPAPVNMKIVVVTTLGNTGRSRMVRSTSPWTYLWILVFWTR